MSYWELGEYIKELKRTNDRPQLKRLVRKLEVARQDKLSLPFASLMFAVLGTPLGIRRHRSGKALGFGISILVIFGYYTLWHSMSILGENGMVPPFVAAWVANVVALMVGLWLTIRASR
jgi:lipopolysaccharide export system permease protein